jgi:glycosyltransferase involved in cell wall biosynthesis
VKISIVTPSFNQAEFIEQTIDSVLSQNYPNLEYIIIDGGSNDGSVDIIKKYARHLSYWVSEKDRGQSHAINKGYHRVTGEVFNWINSDDYLQPDALKIVAENFRDQSVQVLLGRGNVIQHGKAVRLSIGTDLYENNLAKTIGYARIDQPETWFRRNRFDAVMPLTESLHYVMDKHLWIQYLLQFGLTGFKKIDDVIINFRIHPNSKTSSMQDGFLSETDTLFYTLAKAYDFHKEAEFIAKNFNTVDQSLTFTGTIEPNVIRQALHYFLLYKADHLYYTGDFERSRKMLSFIQRDLIGEPDKKLVSKLKFRTARLLLPILKQVRKWK